MAMSSSTSGDTNTAANEVWAPVPGIERRLPHEPMDTGLGAQPSVGVLSLEAHGGALDARHVPFGHLDQLGRESPSLAPSAGTSETASRPSPAPRCRRSRPGCRETRWMDPSRRRTSGGTRGRRADRQARLRPCRPRLRSRRRIPLRPGRGASRRPRGRSRGDRSPRRSARAPRALGRAPAPWAGSFQTSGDSSSRPTSSSFSRRVSMSKIPPSGIETPSHVLDAGMDCVSFFHGETLRENDRYVQSTREYKRRRMVLQRR